MSHEQAEPGRAAIYTMPERPSDALRSLEFDAFFRDYRGSAFSVRTADGWCWLSSAVQPPRFVASFRTRKMLDAVTGDATEARLGRIFLDGDLDIQGDLFALLGVAEYTLRHSEGLSRGLIQTVGRLRGEITQRLKPGRRQAGGWNWHSVPCPLDLPVEFFESWLGSRLGHCCAAFRHPEEDFAAAQQNALDRACGWLQLEKGDRLLDVGCGWGSFLLHAAERRGADAQGVSSSDGQAEVAAERIHRRGLQRQCAVECRDMRRSPYRAECFDKIADLGIFEQVNAAQLGDYLRGMQRMLVPEGLLLLHRVTRSRPGGMAGISGLEADFRYAALSREIEVAESSGMDVVRLDSLQHEYEQTLRVWIEQLSTGAACGMGGDRGRRAWLLYLVEMATSLQAGELQVYRMLLRRRPRRRAVAVPGGA